MPLQSDAESQVDVLESGTQDTTHKDQHGDFALILATIFKRTISKRIPFPQSRLAVSVGL